MKPKKPHKDFPLFPHANGQWAKKIRGKAHYFGKWDDPQAALQRYLEQKDYLLTGRQPPGPGLTILEILDRFLVSRHPDLKTGELSQRTYDDYVANCRLLCELAGDATIESMDQADWKALRGRLAEGVSVTTFGNRVRMARIALKHYESITGMQIGWGKEFRGPTKRAQRKYKAERGKMLLNVEQILEAIDRAKNPQLKAMILLGINCAFQNSDCSDITWDKIDLERGWHTFERPKTYIARKGKLWPETIYWLRQIRKGKGRVFLTRYNQRWSTSSIQHEAVKVGIRYSWLRKTHRTIADGTKDPVACRIVMGHAAGNPGEELDDIYIQSVPEARLEAVSDAVRTWLYGPLPSGS